VDAATTERLTLVPITEQVARAATSGDRATLDELVGGVVPNEWPGDVTPMLPTYADLIARAPGEIGWGPWLAIEQPGNQVVADLGFKGSPGMDGTVEIGFGTITAHRGRGLATEAACALVAWAFAHDDVTAVLAECERDNLASARVLEKVGMHRTGEAGTLLLWRIDRSFGNQ
jgi:ribosomal-protein-alanine N-acetyltransferase